MFFKAMIIGGIIGAVIGVMAGGAEIVIAGIIFGGGIGFAVRKWIFRTFGS